MFNMKNYSKYKFAIKQILESKSGNTIPTLRKELMQKLDVSSPWLSRILNAKLDSKIKLEHEQLVKIADTLNCDIDKLITEQCRLKIRKSVATKSKVVTAAA